MNILMAFYENRSQSKYFDLEKGIELIRKFLKISL